MTDRGLTVTQAAERLGVSVTTVRRWTNAGLLPCWRTPGGWRRYDPVALDRWREKHREVAQTSST